MIQTFFGSTIREDSPTKLMEDLLEPNKTSGQMHNQ
jgi:hypothetical protein